MCMRVRVCGDVFVRVLLYVMIDLGMRDYVVSVSLALDTLKLKKILLI